MKALFLIKSNWNVKTATLTVTSMEKAMMARNLMLAVLKNRNKDWSVQISTDPDLLVYSPALRAEEFSHVSDIVEWTSNLSMYHKETVQKKTTERKVITQYPIPRCIQLNVGFNAAVMDGYYRDEFIAHTDSPVFKVNSYNMLTDILNTLVDFGLKSGGKVYKQEDDYPFIYTTGFWLDARIVHHEDDDDTLVLYKMTEKTEYVGDKIVED